MTINCITTTAARIAGPIMKPVVTVQSSTIFVFVTKLEERGFAKA